MENKLIKKKKKTSTMSTNQKSSKLEDDSRNRSPHLPNIPKSPATSVPNSGKQAELSSDESESESENFSEIEVNAIKAADAAIKAADQKDRIAATKETQRLEKNAREAQIAADAVAQYKESVLLEQQRRC